MFRARVVTPWIGIGNPASDPFRPLLADEYQVFQSDVTGQPSENIAPVPNEYTVEITCEDAVMAAIEADPNYEILWSEEITDAS